MNYGKIENNKVVDIIVADDEAFVNSLDGLWVLLNGDPIIDSDYDPLTGTTTPPKPFPSWILDQDSNNWMPPIPVPINETPEIGYWFWNEDETKFVYLNREATSYSNNEGTTV